jgi:hypothetical protein
VIIHRDGQTAATTEAAALEHIPPVLGGHTSTKTMDSQAAVDLWLIRSFGRHDVPFITIFVIFLAAPAKQSVFVDPSFRLRRRLAG